MCSTTIKRLVCFIVSRQVIEVNGLNYLRCKINIQQFLYEYMCILKLCMYLNPNSSVTPNRVATQHLGKADVDKQEGVYFSYKNSLHSSFVARPIYSKTPPAGSHVRGF